LPATLQYNSLLDEQFPNTDFVCSVAEEELDEFNIHVARHRPEELTKLAKTTKFSRKEIQLIYRGFKQVRRTARRRLGSARLSVRQKQTDWSTRWRSCLRHYATSRKAAGSIPDEVIGFFN
jgi:hypothetical protein